MTRQLLELSERDLTVLAGALHTDGEALRDDLEQRPWHANDVLRRPEVVDTVVGGDEQVIVSPQLFFAVVVQRAAEELSATNWVDEWIAPGHRLPVCDVEPLLEFADAPGRLIFAAQLLVGFASPGDLPVPIDGLDLDDLVDWLAAVEPADRLVLLRQLGDLALFRAGIFPDTTGAAALSISQAEHLGGSVDLSDDELEHLVDHHSLTPGLDALETLSSAWYRAAVEESPAAPPVLRDVAHRIRAARRFLNYVADHYVLPVAPTWALGS